MSSLIRSCSPFQISTYPKANPILNPRQPPIKYHIYQTITLSNQRYKSIPCESLSIYINNTISIRKHYLAKAVTRNKLTHSSNYNPHLFEIITRSFSLYNISNGTITLWKLPVEHIVQTCLKNKRSRQPYRTNRPKPAGSDTSLSCQEPSISDNG